MPAVLTKMALDQLLMAPLFLVVFFFATKTLEGLPHKLPGQDNMCNALPHSASASGDAVQIISPDFVCVEPLACCLHSSGLTWCAEVLREQYVKTVLAGYLLWPLAHTINFKFVPADLRILYVNWYSFVCLPACLCGHATSQVSHNTARAIIHASQKVVNFMTDCLQQLLNADRGPR